MNNPTYIIHQEIPCTLCDGSKIILKVDPDKWGTKTCPRCRGAGTELMKVDLVDVLKELGVVFHDKNPWDTSQEEHDYQ